MIADLKAMVSVLVHPCLVLVKLAGLVAEGGCDRELLEEAVRPLKQELNDDCQAGVLEELGDYVTSVEELLSVARLLDSPGAWPGDIPTTIGRYRPLAFLQSIPKLAVIFVDRSHVFEPA